MARTSFDVLYFQSRQVQTCGVKKKKMQKRALQREVEALSDEVSRLRMMVQRCVEVREQQQQQQQVGTVGLTTGEPGGVQIPLSNQPLAVLPSLFSGIDGTARLFKVLMDTYPWLVPAELQEAKAVIAEQRRREAAGAAGEKQGGGKKKKRHHRPSSTSEKKSKAKGQDNDDDGGENAPQGHSSNTSSDTSESESESSSTTSSSGTSSSSSSSSSKRKRHSKRSKRRRAKRSSKDKEKSKSKETDEGLAPDGGTLPAGSLQTTPRPAGDTNNGGAVGSSRPPLGATVGVGSGVFIGRRPGPKRIAPNAALRQKIGNPSDDEEGEQPQQSLGSKKKSSPSARPPAEDLDF